MKKLKPGQVFNYNGLLWQVVKTKRESCLDCELFTYYTGGCIDSECSKKWKFSPCIDMCSKSPRRIPFGSTIKLVSKNENARRKIRENAC